MTTVMEFCKTYFLSVVDASDSVVIKEEEDEKFNDVQSDGDATPDETKKTPVNGKTKKAKVKVTVKVERSVVPTTTGVNPEVHTYFLLLSCQTRKL